MQPLPSTCILKQDQSSPFHHHKKTDATPEWSLLFLVFPPMPAPWPGGAPWPAWCPLHSLLCTAQPRASTGHISNPNAAKGPRDSSVMDQNIKTRINLIMTTWHMCLVLINKLQISFMHYKVYSQAPSLVVSNRKREGSIDKLEPYYLNIQMVGSW